MVVTDVDGTLLGSYGDFADLHSCLALWQEVVLVPNSSRPIASLLRSWRQARIDPFPTQVGALGTEVEVNGKRTGWSKRFAAFDRSPFDAVLTGMGFQTNGDEFQTALKASYTVPRERWVDAIAAVSEVAPVQVVTSGEHDFDMIPIEAGKAAPLPFLAEELEVAPERVVAAGNSMNDLTMLMAAAKRIVVGNADQALIDAIGGRAYYSRGHFAAGVKEGIRALGVVG